MLHTHVRTRTLLFEMALYHYLKQQINAKLLDPHGPLSNEIPSTTIMSVNEDRRHTVQQPVKRGSYLKFISEQITAIGKRATEHWVAATVCYYEKQFPHVKESSIHTSRNDYTSELKKRQREGHEDIFIKKLSEMKRSPSIIDRPLSEWGCCQHSNSICLC